MSASRPGISRSHGTIGWTRRHLDVSQGPATMTTVQPPPAPAIVRVHHPAIKAPEFKCYRVIRRFTRNGDLDFEDIGFDRDRAIAERVMDREIGWACVLDPNGKRVSYNGQAMETRS